MTTRIAINGFGRIGRGVLRAILERGSRLEIVAVNDLAGPDVLAHLLQYDTTLGRLDRPVVAAGDAIIVDKREIRALAEREPKALPWQELGVDIVLEATGRFTAADAARAHLDAGAAKVLVSAPSAGADITLAYGVNSDGYDPQRHTIVSNASCTTNALAPLAAVLDELAGIEHGFMTTVHAYTQEQNLQDGPHRDLRRARAAAVNIVPTTTGAAKAIGLVLPQLDGKLSGDSIRVPVPVGSLVELNAFVSRDVTRDEVLHAYRNAAEGRLQGVLVYCEDPIVSSDIAGDPASCIFDSALTRVDGRHVKVVGWYDNEWGFANRVVDTLELMAAGR
ncbi:type I glyceraldehyde-3-phosphate dehydrogenase [Dactylosporangium matsuzakiense]|uniref:Glyceraldehyde-3-phosphate dehydrogenase n=1 Tax=Dactylosporangium matsuzakiense TaxID=53360 RepID=A0A9W6KT75_9ACTN|nr:type I glyceraldehyde-3-phosphate dehydrogenase [Dactylosporangium matsuzakiense]UWZ49177.1 type I glyceraldehyde-3-phosphate dehydrogenase [Dactylosporangium matsuzakiense]GLL06757.1 glyceraldehyde-3-phosphate dehydrogenase [Dactylosporangium matsuzakiense]